MPNWCGNVLVVTGPSEDLIRFKEQARYEYESSYTDKDGKVTITKEKTEFSFNKFIPEPPELKDTVSPPPKPGVPDWYSWRCNNWGIKWDVEADMYEGKGNDGKLLDLNYTFDSPWGPPCEGLLKISKIYTTLTFLMQYEEGGMGFMGQYECKDGVEIQDDQRDIVYGKCPKCGEDSYKNMAGDCTWCGETVDKMIPNKVVS